jgi:predicted phosphoadenosine phosphosulfate sulfurtransferase
MRELYSDVIEHFWWVALPLTTQNSLSQFQPEWQCWEPGTNGSASLLTMPLPIPLFFLLPARNDV